MTRENKKPLGQQRLKKLTFLKKMKLKRLGYFKLPKTGHMWVGSPYKWARITNDRRVMPYSEQFLIGSTFEQLAESWLYVNEFSTNREIRFNNILINLKD